MTLPEIPRRLGMPLAMQMVAILVCALLAAQAVTLALTVILPPRPAERWNMDEVAGALGGGPAPKRLERKAMRGPPDVSGQGWLVSESSRDALARRIGQPANEVVLAFYTQLPVGGVAVPSSGRSPLAVKSSGSGSLSSLLIDEAQAQAIPGGPPASGSAGPTGMPGGGFPGGRMPGGNFPGGGFPGSGGPRVPAQPGSSMPRPNLPGGQIGGGTRGATPGQAGGGRPGAGSASSPGNAAGNTAGIGAGEGGRPIGSPGATRGPGAFAQPGLTPGIGLAPPSPVIAIAPPIAQPSAAAEPIAETQRAPARPAARSTTTAAIPTAAIQPQPVASAHPVAAAAAIRAPDVRPQTASSPQPIPFRRVTSSLFDVTSPPFIEGDFVAAARQADGSWLAVAPRAEPFPNAWQTRVMLWFALSLAIVSPLAWLFVRRIVVPLRDFARAAEQLGRDPSATILPLSGPAEIGRAANAFNQMRHRLRAFVDDRTAMVGAISHDLRTPLTRLRFRIEDVPDDQREGLLKEVTEMEAMISQVIAFIRDASTPGPRQRLDFAELIAGSVADWQLVGANVEIERNAHIPVEVDPVGIRRLLGNLLENAVKYGDSARVRVSLSGNEAVAEIVDAGPGIPEDEFDRAFEPFYRSEAARKSGRNGSGLGLAVCRSIARAHGGDVSFAHGQDGFVARVTVPAAFVPTLRKAA
ncbi:ATP-binding protein [Novosphingobium sp. fls2-241-R2A-195]|jgi:signal transduction histidine kinase|uniref:ATP-binding protein n=1 Tax=Novosphingobium sp. fls2-241-R2A-195 TaxID=3040296 RepID=UPI00254FFE31|nr:ATP-binding protein [Novosphingobium sp. fls2-241-R2A-195]